MVSFPCILSSSPADAIVSHFFPFPHSLVLMMERTIFFVQNSSSQLLCNPNTDGGHRQFTVYKTSEFAFYHFPRASQCGLWFVMRFASNQKRIRHIDHKSADCNAHPLISLIATRTSLCCRFSQFPSILGPLS